MKLVPLEKRLSSVKARSSGGKERFILPARWLATLLTRGYEAGNDGAGREADHGPEAGQEQQLHLRVFVAS